MNYKQIGNPDKLVNLLVKLSNMAEPPVRLAAGSDGMNYVLEKAENLRSEAEHNKKLSVSTDGDTDTTIKSFSEIGK